MLITCINEQLLVHLATEPVLWQHTFHCSFDDHFGSALQEVFGNFFFTSTRITCIVVVNFFIHFVAGEFDFVCVDHDNEVATVNVRGVVCFVLAAQNCSNTSTHTSHGLIGTVHNIPVALNGSRIRMLCCKM